MSEESIALLSRASEMLIEATTIQKAKELKDLCLTAADWARRKGLGEAAIQHAKYYSFLAERRMGVLLKATERAKGGGDQKSDHQLPRVTGDPTLADMGITKRESAEAQVLADMPEEEFGKVVAGKKTVTQVRRELKRAEVLEKVATLPSEKYRVIYAACWECRSPTFSASGRVLAP